MSVRIYCNFPLTDRCLPGIRKESRKRQGDCVSALGSQVLTERGVTAGKSCGMRCPTQQQFGVKLGAMTFPNAICLEAASRKRTDHTS